MVEPIMQLPAALGDYRRCTPIPRVGEVEDIANLALFLLSTLPATSPAISVDGGRNCGGAGHLRILEPAFGADGLRGVSDSF